MLLRRISARGESYNFRSKVLTAAGTYYDTLRLSTAPCDTVFKLTLVQRPEYNSTTDVTICKGETYQLGSQVLTSSGSYTESLTSQYGCDSIVSVNLDVDTVSIGVTTNFPLLTANAIQSENTFQWYDCEAETIIPNETSKSFTYTTPGYHAVIVTNNASSCVDTSECYSIFTGIGELETGEKLKLVPNPATNSTQLLFDKSHASISIRIVNNIGKTVSNLNYQDADKVTIDVQELTPGIYFIEVLADRKTSVIKMLKE